MNNIDWNMHTKNVLIYDWLNMATMSQWKSLQSDSNTKLLVMFEDWTFKDNI